MPHLTESCSRPAGLLNGQLLIQLAQSVPFLAQNSRHVSALIGHLKIPNRFDILLGLSVGSPYAIDLLGHLSAHFSHFKQKSQTPNAMGLSGNNGRSVNTLANRTLGPNSGVISRPLRANSPSPASMAMGMLQAVSLPQAMALYPNPLI